MSERTRVARLFFTPMPALSVARSVNVSRCGRMWWGRPGRGPCGALRGGTRRAPRGLPPDAVEILGAADEHVTTTRYHVTPIVGWIRGPFTPRSNPSEVSRAFSALLEVFRDRGILRVMPIETLRRFVRSYRVDGEIVWGLTAAILGDLVNRRPP